MILSSCFKRKLQTFNKWTNKYKVDQNITFEFSIIGSLII